MAMIKLPTDYTALTVRERRMVREHYVQLQEGKCWYCQNPLSGEPTKEVLSKILDISLFPPGFLRNPIHLQHDHQTNLTEGAVHARCNGVLWQYHNR